MEQEEGIMKRIVLATLLALVAGCGATINGTHGDAADSESDNDTGRDTAPEAEPPCVSTLEITADLSSHPYPFMGIALGDDSWRSMADYHVRNTGDEAVIERINVATRGVNVLGDPVCDAANFAEVGVWMSGVLLAHSRLPPGSDQNTDIDLTGSPITVPAGSSDVMFQIVATLSPVVASSSVGGSVTGVARSGNMLLAGINAGFTGLPWGETYHDRINVHASSRSSGQPRYMCGTTGLYQDAYMLRKAVPTVPGLPLPTTSIADGMRTVMARFQMTSRFGQTAVRKMTFEVVLPDAVLSRPLSPRFDQFRLRRGTTDLPLTEVRIRDRTGMALDPGIATLRPPNNLVVVVFQREEVVPVGAFNDYELSAVITQTQQYDTVTTHFMAPREASGGGTGWLTDFVYEPMTANVMTGPNLERLTRSPSTGRADMPGYFLWSDLSEVPHSFSTGRGSSDWITHHLLEGLGYEWILMAP